MVMVHGVDAVLGDCSGGRRRRLTRTSLSHNVAKCFELSHKIAKKPTQLYVNLTHAKEVRRLYILNMDCPISLFIKNSPVTCRNCYALSVHTMHNTPCAFKDSYRHLGEAGINVHDVLPVATPQVKQMMPPADRIYDPSQGAKKDLTDTGDDFLAIGPALRIMQLNVEGLSVNNSAYDNNNNNNNNIVLCGLLSRSQQADNY